MENTFRKIGGLVLGLMLLAGAFSSRAGADSRVYYNNGRSSGYSSGYSNGHSSYHSHHYRHHHLRWTWHPHRPWHHRHHR
jgi:hypothetical protein